VIEHEKALGCLSQGSLSLIQPLGKNHNIHSPDCPRRKDRCRGCCPSLSVHRFKFAVHNHRLAPANAPPGQIPRPNPHTASACSRACLLDGCKNRSGLNTSGSGCTPPFRVMALWKRFGPGVNPTGRISTRNSRKHSILQATSNRRPG
jgi:hypothetical protein